MNNKKSTKKALLMSALSLLLCCSMLVGTTFAWFTDEVKSGQNQILAGNLDVEVYNSLTVGQNKVDANTKLFSGITYWEPGVVAYENLTVANLGNLALKYQLSVNFTNENTVEYEGVKYGLSDVLQVAVVPGGVDETAYPNTAEGRAKLLNFVQSSEGVKKNTFESFVEKGALLPKNYTGTVDGAASVSQSYGLVIWWEPSANDNIWNVNNGRKTSDGEALHIDLGINLVATQLVAESDSFGPEYDDLADKWDGSVGNVPTEENGVITLNTAAELAAFAKSVNDGTAYSGKTVKLGADINLNNEPWTPIGDCESGKYFQGTFDGQGHTIYNLSVDDSNNSSEFAHAGLFGWVDAAMATVKNVNLENATVMGSHWVGGIAGYFTGRIENCSVSNSTITGFNVNGDANGDKVGGIVGCLNEHSYLNGNTVTNCEITGNRDIGGIAGSVAASTYEMKDNKVENTTVYFSTEKDYGSAGVIVSGRTGYVANDTNTAINVTVVQSFVVKTPEELANALKSTSENILVTLDADIDVSISSLGNQTPGSGEYKLAGENTESLIINLNNHKLNITTTYWSSIGAKNNGATITIKNGNMTSSQATGTWNSYDLTFANCNYVIEDVTFEKAIAFTNADKTVTMKDVTINETHDYYALWISACGQNVEIENLTINSEGRGIKIDEEYVGTPAKVALNISNSKFNTAKKAAIMVKSAAGADITVNNVDISNVKSDATNVVWVDEDAYAYEADVTVTGGTKANEGELITDNADLDEAINSGKTVIELTGGTYIIPDSAKGKTLTIIGLGDTVIAAQDDGAAEGDGDYSFDGSTVTFENVTITTSTTYFPGFVRMKGTYNNCTINGVWTLYDNSEFNKCTFNVSGDIYNVWTWGAKEAKFTNCTFNNDGKAVLLYGTVNTKLTIDGCTFNDNGGLTDLKAAIEIGNDYGKSYELIVNNTTVNGYEINDKGISTGTTLWANKNSMGTDKLNVVVDGVDVY